MSAEDRVKVLEGEFKLIKSELRQTLGSVRDFLLDLKIPQMQEEAAKQAVQQQQQPVSGGNAQGGGGSGDQGSGQEGFSGGGMPEGEAPSSQAQEPPPTRDEIPETPIETPEAEKLDIPSDDLDIPADDLGSNDTGMSSGDMPGEEEPQTGFEDEKVQSAAPEATTTPQVNLLANLIRWASVARKEIGIEQLPVFLEVYATTGNLTDETKETILHLAKIAADPMVGSIAPDKTGPISEEIAICMEINSLGGQLPPEFKDKIRRLTELILMRSVGTNKADVWSQLMLELHGILTGAGTSLQPLSITKNDLIEEERTMGEDGEGDFCELPEEPEEISAPRYTKPARLRLVLPANDGAEQELDLGSLFISTDSPAKSDLPAKKGNGHKNIVSPKRK